MILTRKRLLVIFFSLADYQNHSHFASLRALISSPGLSLLFSSSIKKAKGGSVRRVPKGVRKTSVFTSTSEIERFVLSTNSHPMKFPALSIASTSTSTLSSERTKNNISYIKVIGKHLNFLIPIVNHRDSICLCGPNPVIWPFKLNLFSSPFTKRIYFFSLVSFYRSSFRGL